MFKLLLISISVLTYISAQDTLPFYKIKSDHYRRILQANNFTQCYGIMHDAGSSGTRAYIYKWNCTYQQTLKYINLSELPPNLNKSNTPLATFANHTQDLGNYFKFFFDQIKNVIPSGQWNSTPVMLGATAGMRILAQSDQDNIINATRAVFNSSGFMFLEANWVRVITGQEEGAFMWLSLNYLLNLIRPNITINQTATIIDVGGASTQIAFSPASQDQNMNLSDFITLNIPNFTNYYIYSTTYLGYGNDMAREAINNQSIQAGSFNIITPCYHSGYNGTWKMNSSYTIQGTGNQTACLDLIDAYLNSSDCPRTDGNCAVQQNYQPQVYWNATIYGVNGITNAASNLKLTNYTLNDLQSQMQNLIGLTWSQVQSNANYNNSYASTNYFLTLYTYELLKQGYKIPLNAQNIFNFKQIYDSTIHSPSTIQNNTPTWALGAMLYQAAPIDYQTNTPARQNNTQPTDVSNLAYKLFVSLWFIMTLLNQ